MAGEERLKSPSMTPERVGIYLACVLWGLTACAYGGGRDDVDAGPRPTPPTTRDAGVSPARDAGPVRADSATPPVRPDAGFGARDAGGPIVPPPWDAGRRMDASVRFDAGFDASSDGGFDSGLDLGDGPLDLPPGWVERASATFVPTFGSNGLGVGTTFQVGWRFEIAAGTSLSALQFGFHDRGGMGTVFGAIVRLDGPDDAPDTVDMSGSDVIAAPTLGSLLGHRGHVTIDTDVVLEAGWYALVFGGDLAGAVATGDRAGPAFGHMPEATEQPAFSISTRTGSLFMQRTGARFFVRGTAITP